MDSITQATLGAAIAQVGLGKTLGRKAALWGAVCATLPDLDVLVPLGDPISDYAYHRSATHSLLVLSLVAPLLTLLAIRIHRIPPELRLRWFITLWAVLVTHPLLDSLTIYGTQLFWPFAQSSPVSISSIFIIDLFYTLPLLAGVIVALCRPQNLRAPAIGLAFSSLYLVWGLGTKQIIDSDIESQLQKQKIAYSQIVSSPTPLSLDWRIVVMTKDQPVFYEVYRSVLDSGDAKFMGYPTRNDLLPAIREFPSVKLMQWFTHGFYKITQVGEQVVMTDVRMGIEPDYIFAFVVGQINADGKVVPLHPVRLSSRRDNIAVRVFSDTPP